METTDTIDTQYKEAYNVGYWLATGKEPLPKDVLKRLTEVVPPGTAYQKGLMAGKKQMEKENLARQIENIRPKDRGNLR